VDEAYLRIEKVTTGKVQGREPWEDIPLSTDAVLIARPSNDPGAIEPDIKILGDDYVSRRPVQVHYSYTEGCYMLTDPGTMNGTFLNGEVIENDGRPYRLKDNDVIGLARVAGEMRVLLRFRLTRVTRQASDTEDSWKPPAKKGLSVNIPARRVFVDGREIALTKTEWKLFECLHSNRGRVCTMDDLTWEVWGADSATSELVAKYVQRLRDKIEPTRSKPMYIITHSTGGYVLQT
jgi:hypothetical protein